MRLKRSAFVAWLKEKPPTQIVGERRDCHACPVSRFYFETSGGCEVVIFDDGTGLYTIDRGYRRDTLPWWVQRFIFAVDGDVTKNITAARALEHLAALPA